MESSKYAVRSIKRTLPRRQLPAQADKGEPNHALPGEGNRREGRPWKAPHYELLGVWVMECVHSLVRNWRDPLGRGKCANQRESERGIVPKMAQTT